jgi:hypothetical protein
MGIGQNRAHGKGPDQGGRFPAGIRPRSWSYRGSAGVGAAPPAYFGRSRSRATYGADFWPHVNTCGYVAGAESKGMIRQDR